VRELLEQDSLLAAKLVRVAQSALYNRGSAIASIDDAITRIGLHNAGDVFLQTALSARVFRAKGYDAPMEAIRRHSIATAHLARLTRRLTSLPDEYAFMCGLLHDVGMAAGLLILATDQRHPPPFAGIANAVQAVHEEASAILANAWQLPQDVELVLRHHHQFMVGNRPHPLAAAVCVADWLASEAGAALGGEVRDQTAGNAARSLGLSSRDLESLSVQARDVVAAL
jgi:HD-like signal output (HDOD) protein